MDVPRIVRLAEMGLLSGDLDSITVGRPDWELGRKQPELVQQIDVRLLRVREQPRRKKHTEDEVAALAAELREGPLRNAIHVRPDPQDPDVPLLLHGEGRVRAWCLMLSQLAEAGSTGLDYRIATRLRTESKVEREWRLEQGLDNDQASLMDPFDMATSYREWLYDPDHGAHPDLGELGRRIALLSKRTGKSKPVIESRLRLLMLCPDVREQVVAGRVEISDASQLGRISDTPGQIAMMKRVILEGVKGNALVAAVTEALRPRDPAPPSGGGSRNGPPTGTGRRVGRPSTIATARSTPGKDVMVKAAGFAKGVPGEPGFLAFKVLATAELPTEEVIRQLEHFLTGIKGGRELEWQTEPAVGFE